MLSTLHKGGRCLESMTIFGQQWARHVCRRLRLCQPAASVNSIMNLLERSLSVETLIRCLIRISQTEERIARVTPKAGLRELLSIVLQPVLFTCPLPRFRN